MAETQQQKLAREMTHKHGKVDQSARDNPLTGSAMQALARGWLAGTIGIPGDLEGLGRMGLNALGAGVDKHAALPTTDFFKEWLPGKQTGDENVATVGSMLGGAGVGTARQVVRNAAKAAPGALTQMARNAAMPRQLSAQAGVIKAPGGNWLTGSVEDALKGLKTSHPRSGEAMRAPVMQDGVLIDPLTGLAVEDAQLRPLTQGSALNQFIDKQLTRYVKNDMATERDPIRALAEQGTLHFQPEMVAINPPTMRTEASRIAAGFPGEGMGKAQLAKQWEVSADNSIVAKKAGAMGRVEGVSPKRMAEENPWLAKVPEGTPVYDAVGRERVVDLGFDHLIDELRNATNPASGLPRELLLKPESLDRVSVPQAVEHVAKINAWREAQKVEANQAIANNAATVLHKEYADAATNPKGLKWVELKAKEGANPAYLGDGKYEDPAMQALKDALKYEGDTMGHCVGGYCDDVASGNTRILSLRDAKGQPHVTVELGKKTSSGSDDIRRWRAQAEAELASSGLDPQTSAYATKVNARISELQNNQPESIIQIKGKGNRKPNDEYLPFVQDFVKSGKWSDVGDLNNTGLQRADWQADTLAEMTKHGIQAPAYGTPDEINAVINALNKAKGFGNKGFAKGGPVTADCSCEHKGYADGGAVNSYSTPDVNPQPQAAGGWESYDENQTPQAIAARAEQQRRQAAHTARNTMSREDFLKKYGQTFVADDKGGNAASEVAGQDVGAYYDLYLADGATGDGSGFGWKYRDANPYFDAWDNVDPHPESQDLGAVGEFWRQIGRPVATAAATYFGVNALGGMLGGAGAAGTGAAAAGTGGAAGIGSGTVLGGGAAAAPTASGVAGMMGMAPGYGATALNTGVLNTGMSLVRGKNIGDSLKSGATSALLSPISSYVGDAVGGGYTGQVAGDTVLGGVQGAINGQGFGKGLQDGFVNGLVSSAGKYVGGVAKGATGNNFAGTAANSLTQSTLRGRDPKATLDSLATQYAAGELTDLSGMDPKMAQVVITLARNKKVSPVGALTIAQNAVGSPKLRKAAVGG